MPLSAFAEETRRGVSIFSIRAHASDHLLIPRLAIQANISVDEHLKPLKTFSNKGSLFGRVFKQFPK